MKDVKLCFWILVFYFFTFSVLAQTPQDQLKQIRSTVTEKVDGRTFYIHTVKRGQTLYMISKAYGVDINAVILENPQVKDGIKAEQKIRIPSEDDHEVKVQQTTKPGVVNPLGVEEKKLHAGQTGSIPKKDSLNPHKQATASSPDTTMKKSMYKVALMLPLYLGEVSEIDTENLPENPVETYKSLQFIQFYEGFRISLDSLAKTGVRVKLFVYDVDKDTLATRQLLKNPELKNMDLMVGLIYHRNFQIVAEFAQKNKISIVNPISERSELVSDNPFVIKIRPAEACQLSQLAGYLEKNYAGAKLFFLRDGQFKEKEDVEELRKECIHRKLNIYPVESINVAMNSIIKEKENVVLAFSSSTSYILELSRRLYEVKNDYNLTLVGMPSWDRIERLEKEYLVGLHTHLMVPSFVDYQNPEAKAFIGKFQDQYKTDPDPLAFLGYDVAQYFVSALWKNGTGFLAHLPVVPKKGIQTTFDLKSVNGNGYENQHWEIIKYDNYRLIPVN